MQLALFARTVDSHDASAELSVTLLFFNAPLRCTASPLWCNAKRQRAEMNGAISCICIGQTPPGQPFRPAAVRSPVNKGDKPKPL